MIVWIHGPSGSGKSTVGAFLAELRGCRFVDLDAEIESTTAMSVERIFAELGEPEFRRIERDILASVATDRAGDAVVAVGGGAVLDPENRDRMRASGVRVFLDISSTEAAGRLGNAPVRPLLAAEPDAWERLYRERLPLYRDAELTVVSAGRPFEVAERIASRLEEVDLLAWSLSDTLGGERTEVALYRSAFAIGRRLDALAGSARRFVVTDADVYRHHRHVAESFAGEGGAVFVCPVGEAHKTLATVEELASGLLRNGALRDDLIVAFGGGVVTDMSGFLASIYQRGLRCVYVPTSLLAQVDAAIGGKTAVDFAGVRNLIGTVRQPTAVLVSTGFLHTLPSRELRSGLVESLKMGLALDPGLLRDVERLLPEIAGGRVPDEIEQVVRGSIAAKMRVVREDTFDTGGRLVLNFGHTFGHALEAAEPGAHTHGEAVAFGMIAAAELALRIGAISESRLSSLVGPALPLSPTTVADHDPESIVEAMGADKKRSGAGLRFVLPLEEGGVEIRTIDDRVGIVASIERAFHRIEHYHRRT